MILVMILVILIILEFLVMIFEFLINGKTWSNLH